MPKLQQLPTRYEPGFMQALDRRTEIYKRLSDSYEAVVSDAGGPDALSHTKLSLIERFVFLEAILANLEHKIAIKPKDTAELLSRWIQGLNSLQGLARAIGLERSTKRSVDLKAYVRERG